MADTSTRPGRFEPTPVRRRPKPMPWPLNLYQTAVGRKWVMALTGLGLLGFVLVHMIGNLHIYEGPNEMHEYAEALRDLGGHLIPRTVLLWIMRLGLIAMFVLHIHSAYSLKEQSRKASDKAGYVSGQKKYAGGQDFIAANYASRTMRWTGPIVLLFLLFHLADLTWGWWSDDWVRGDPYHNVVNSLSNVPVALIYIAANIALALHIFHGAWSMFQSLGINNPRFNGARRGFAAGFALVILVGNLSFPIMVQAEVINEDNRTCPVGEFTEECLEGEAAAEAVEEEG